MTKVSVRAPRLWNDLPEDITVGQLHQCYALNRSLKLIFIGKPSLNMCVCERESVNVKVNCFGCHFNWLFLAGKHFVTFVLKSAV